MNFSVQLREQTGKGPNRRLRQIGMTPGVVYGINEPLPVAMHAEKALRFIKSMKGATKVFKLAVESNGKQEEKSVVLQDYQTSNWGDKLLHADFREVTENTVIATEIPIKIINEEICPAIKTGGVLQTIRHTVPIRCAVKDLQEIVEIDVQDLNFGESVHVLDLKYADGVEPIVTGRNFTIVTVAGRTSEEEEVEEGEELEDVAGEAESEEQAE